MTFALGICLITSPDAYKEIKRLLRRCNHFIGPFNAKANNRQALAASPEGMGIAAHNYNSMQADDDSYLERLFWLDACAASFNRYIDSHKIEGDDNALNCLSWWRSHLFFDPEKLH